MDSVQVTLDFGDAGVQGMGRIASVDGQTYFQYDRDFLDGEVNPAPYSFSFDGSLQKVEREGMHLVGAFADVLPDGWAKHVLDGRLTVLGYDPNQLSPVDRLALIDGNSIGALTFRPNDPLDAEVPSLTIDDLAATVIRQGGKGDAGIEVARKLVGSLGGIRPKANIWIDDDRVSARPIAGADPWIIKFPNPTYDKPNAGVIEFAYSLMARAAKINMAPTRLIESRDGPGFFATARFDRSGGERFHFQSLSGLLSLAPLARSTYQALIGIDMQLCGRDAPSEQLTRRMVFNVLACNRDDHTRNHGFLLNSKGLWATAPAFDITFSDLVQHELIVGKDPGNPEAADLREVVTELGGDPGMVDDVIKDVRDAVEVWPDFAAEAGLDTETSEMIRTRLSTIANDGMDPAALVGFMASRGMGR